MSHALDMATDLLAKDGKPAYVEFSTVPKELKRKSEEEGHYVATDVDVVCVRQIGATDSVIFEVDRWLKENDIAVKAGRLPLDHARHYRKMYELWKSGQEMPLEGTPIKGWAVISPSQQETIIRAGIRTVEDLATMNAEAATKIGMGNVMMKDKAHAWLAQAKDKGPLTMEMADLKAKNALQELQLEKLREQIESMQAEMKHKAALATVQQQPLEEEDIIEAMTVQPRRGPGRPRKEA